ncbi:MAG: efflux RND transporter periplasmic adaptor subunit [Planctomycetaceae bacterium]|nr:efflux RND transporter periplasmic adaptor subunit [Planctomycetaceae bacterium]
MFRVITSFVLILVLLFSAMHFFKTMASGRPEVQQREITETVYNVDAFEVQPVTFTELLTAFGTSVADREVVVAAQVSGEVVEIHPSLKVGQAVSAGAAIGADGGTNQPISGDLLLKIDQRDFQQRVEQTKASIAGIQTEIEQLSQQKMNAERQLALARQDLQTLQDDYDRVKTLRDRGAGLATDLTRSLLELRRYQDTIVQLENQISLHPHQLEAARQRLTAAEADLKRANNDLLRTEVVPPFSGVLSEVMVEQGQYVRNGEPLVRIVDSSRIEIPVSLGLEDYLLIQDAVESGHPPEAWLAENETAPARWKGYVVRVSPTADASSRTIEVFIEVINSDQDTPLLPGTFVFARINGPRFDNALIIPRESIVEDTVFVVNNSSDKGIGHAEKKHLKTGRRLQSLVVVHEGLKAGDRVVMTNLDVIQSGTGILPQQTISPMDEIQRIRVPVIQMPD